MQIEEEHSFRFIFPFMGTKAILSVVANTQSEAAQKIMDWMQTTMIELSVAFPKEAKPKKSGDMLELRIQTIISDLAKYMQIREDTASTVKAWINMEYAPNEYPVIIQELENLLNLYVSGKVKKAGK